LQLLQFVECHGRILGTVLDRARRKTGEECGHACIDARTSGRDIRHILMHVLEHQRHRIVRGERHLAGQHLPSHDAYGIQVSLRRCLIVLNHFWRQIGGRAQQHAGGGQRGLRHRLGQAEIGDLHMSSVIEQNILRFDIAVHHACAMRRSQAVQRLTDYA